MTFSLGQSSSAAGYTFGVPMTRDQNGQFALSGTTPLLSFDNFGIGATPGSYSLGTPVPGNDAALALSGPLGGSPATATPTAAERAAAAAAQNNQDGYGAGGLVWSLGQLAKSALSSTPASSSTPSANPPPFVTPAGYTTGASSGAMSSKTMMEIGLVLVAAFAVFEMVK